jgi:hypothetical protein
MKSVLPALLICLLSTSAWAQTDREDSIFGEESDDEAPLISEEKLQAADDKLQLGGLMYMRFNARITDGDRLDDHALSTPNLVDLYLDSRPSERLRGFVRGRLKWNPTLDVNAPQNAFNGAKQTEILLDQLWLKFDIHRHLFVTLGKQPIRWGATRIWNPVDMVNSTRRVPLELFDERTGVSMLKLHLPIESLGWNLYALALIDQADSIDETGVAGRAEFVLGTMELALSGAWRKDTDAKAGIDLSAGVLDLDLVSEAGMTFDGGSPTLQVSGGLEYGVRYSDSDVIYLGAEWFYNQNGTSDTSATALFTGETQFFYSGRHYGAVFISLPYPGLWNNTTFALSTVGNLSDRSFVTRLDMIQRVLTFMTLQCYAQVHYGRPGELTLGADAMTDTEKTLFKAALYPDDPSRELTNPIVDLGVWLRIDL